jgi:ssDNA-binding Zn-finger/Zn-ribbon topoisomerase 1
MMIPDESEQDERSEWESVHKCPKCGYELNLAKLDLGETTTGIATCPRCEWAGQINLQIVPGQNSTVK